MKIGCPREVKNNENRVGLTPNAVKAYSAAGHQVFMERGAGHGSAVSDEAFIEAGAKICESADEVWQQAEMIVKVKEPMPEEYHRMRENQVIYTYFHFAADEELTRVCQERKVIAVAYETVEEKGTLPLLRPMSEVAGRMASLMGAFYIARSQGGRGLLPMGVTGVAPAKVAVIGGGVVGTNAAKVAAGLGADVTILDVNLDRLEYLSDVMPANVHGLYSDPVNLENSLIEADIVIGAVLIPGAKAPKLIRREHLSKMKEGSVLVDVAVDQGGCAETTHPTTHSDPVYTVDGVLHYCVANMPGAYARTSTFALNNATIPYGLKLAGLGVEEACRRDAALRLGLNMYKGKITYEAVAQAFGLEADYVPVESVLG